MTRINLLLGACAVVLAMLLLWDRESKGPATPVPVSQLAPQSVEKIELFLGDVATPGIVLQRQAGSWQLTRPVRIAADPFAVEQILALLQTPSRDRRDPAAMDLAKLKLAPPLWRVRYDGFELRVGAVEALRQQRYVQTDSGLHLVDDFNPGPFDGNYADLVSRRLLPGVEQLQQIRWPDTRVSKAEDLTARIRQNWLQAEAQWTARPLPADFKAVTSRISVVTPQRIIEFLIAGREPRLKLIRPDIDVLYNLPGSAGDELLQP